LSQISKCKRPPPAASIAEKYAMPKATTFVYGLVRENFAAYLRQKNAFASIIDYLIARNLDALLSTFLNVT
jgi:hypothetical protein